MSISTRIVIDEIVESALRELSDAEYQQRVWVAGSPDEMSSMDEAVAALFDDSGLGVALEVNEITFTREADAELRELRAMLRSSLADKQAHDTAAVMSSAKWRNVRDHAAHVLKLLRARH